MLCIKVLKLISVFISFTSALCSNEYSYRKDDLRKRYQNVAHAHSIQEEMPADSKHLATLSYAAKKIVQENVSICFMWWVMDTSKIW